MKYVKVAVLAQTKENFDTFTYSLPKDAEAKIGQVVKVPFRNRELYAVVLDYVKKPDFKTKEISKTIEIILPKHLITLANWMSEYYAASINSVIRTILPAGFYKKRRTGSQFTVRGSRKVTNNNCTNYKLTPDQENILDVILNNSEGSQRQFKKDSSSQICPEQGRSASQNDKKNKPFLLFGVTGSGKTEIYIRLIEKQIEKRMGSIVLVPEIALTPQTIQRFEERFPEQVAVLHSHLKETERQKSWNDIAEGKKLIAVGSRSAIFAPFKNLGLIVIDEEHESSYKQEQTPRYDALKVAEKISEITGAKLILGSATPRVESFYKARNGIYKFLHLGDRIHGEQMPNVNIVDLRKEYKAGNKSTISIPLQNKIAEVLDRGKKVLLLLNRRGASTYVFCRDCGYVELCPSCEIPLTYHMGVHSSQLTVHRNIKSIKSINYEPKAVNHLLCHHCNFKATPKTTCPNCQSLGFRYLGAGTQKVEFEIKKLFPKANVERMDRDTTEEKGSHAKLYEGFAKGKTDIIVGTQMIAKGWDIGDVDLVGVVLADVGLNFPDFRSEEKTFSLLTQVAGRTGRRKKRGEVIIQTFCPWNLAIISASDHNYENFYNREIQNREALRFPPFSELIKVYFSSNDPVSVSQESAKVKEILEKNMNKKIIQIVGPSPAFIQKQKNMYTWQMIIKHHGNITQDVLKLLPAGWSIDVDPSITI